MERFYVSKLPSADGFLVIHVQTCNIVPQEGDRVFLGMSRTSSHAVDVAQNLFKKVRLCECCSLTNVDAIVDGAEEAFLASQRA